MPKSPEEYAHLEWLGYVQPVGLVVSIPAMLEGQCYVNKNIMGEHARFLSCLPRDKSNEVIPELRDLPEFTRKVLGWEAEDLKEVPQRVALTGDMASLEVVLPQYHETLRPTHAVPAFRPKEDENLWMMLIQELATGTDLDDPGEADSSRHWNAAPQAKFERLLRETQVPIGLLSNGRQLRLVYSPRGETSGHATFNVDEMVQVAGRPMFAALHMLLCADRMFSLGDNQRLPAILQNSRKYQNTVSTKLAEQVLAALYELMRGFQAANDVADGKLLGPVLASDPNHVYSGLLTVLMRLVFVMYAEDRDLLSSDPVYSNYYSVTGLFNRLREDAGRFPDTMDQRFGSWSQLITLFRLVYEGGQHGEFKIPPRKGYLFDPNRYRFLEGRVVSSQLSVVSQEKSASDSSLTTNHQQLAPIPRIPDGVIYRVLRNLLILDGERLSYRTLDVEQIGSVYETVMGFNLEVAAGKSIAIKPMKSHGAPATINLDALLEAKGKDRAKWLKDQSDQSLGAAAAKQLKDAITIAELLEALDKKIQKKVTPRVVPAGAIVLQPSDERRRSGSHYTPRSLTEPIVRTTLEPILKQLVEPAPIREGEAPAEPQVWEPAAADKKRFTKGEIAERIRLSEKAVEAAKQARQVGTPHPSQILDLKICDPAMGSGAFLVETCRQLGDELIKAWYAHDLVPTDIPPDEDEVLYARRQVAQRCLYGVDKNVMAVDLAKLSLWLVTLAKDHAFTFLDHALRHGDSLVGLTRRQIIGFHWEPKKQKQFGEDLIQKRLDRATEARAKILNAREDVPYRDQEQRLAVADEALNVVRLTGDACVSAFFAGSKKKQREDRCEELFASVSDWYASGHDISKRGPIAAAAASLRSGEHPIPPFHWEIEFPEVFSGPDRGFHVMLGNPPFINAIDGGLPIELKAWLKTTGRYVSGAADLAFHFLSKAHVITRHSGSVGFLMPRQFLNTSAAETLRGELMKSRPPALLHSLDDSSLFLSANVHVVSTVFARTSTCFGGIGRLPQPIHVQDTNWWAALVSTSSEETEAAGNSLGDLFSIAASMTTQIAYDIKPLVTEGDEGTHFPRLLTTGLIDPFECLWGVKTCRYLKNDFQRPVVTYDESIPERVKKRLVLTTRPKILVAGVAGPGNRLEAYLDADGNYVGAVSTYTITHLDNSLPKLRRLCSFLNSDEVAELVTTQLAGSAMGSGLLTIPKTFISNLIVPDSADDLTGENNAD